MVFEEIFQPILDFVFQASILVVIAIVLVFGLAVAFITIFKAKPKQQQKYAKYVFVIIFLAVLSPFALGFLSDVIEGTVGQQKYTAKFNIVISNPNIFPDSPRLDFVLAAIEEQDFLLGNVSNQSMCMIGACYGTDLVVTFTGNVNRSINLGAWSAPSMETFSGEVHDLVAGTYTVNVRVVETDGRVTEITESITINEGCETC